MSTPSTPTARTLEYFRELGYVVDKVEQRLTHTIVRDFLGCIDLIALHETEGTIGVQVTSGPNHAARCTKAMAEPRLEAWLRAGNRFQVVSWAKRGPRGKRKVWTVRVQEFNLQDLTRQVSP